MFGRTANQLALLTKSTGTAEKGSGQPGVLRRIVKAFEEESAVDAAATGDAGALRSILVPEGGTA